MSEIKSIAEVIESILPSCKESKLCPYPPGKSGYCFKHEVIHGIEKKNERKRIPKVSEKRKKANVKLAAIVARIKKDRPVCEMRVPGICTGRTQTAHHPQGKIGDLLLDESKMIASCSACNLWEVAHPNEAKEMGISKSRLNIES